MTGNLLLYDTVLLEFLDLLVAAERPKGASSNIIRI